MLKDITLGQFYPADSIIHRLDARIKIIIALALIVLIFLVKGFIGYAVVFGLIVITVILSKVPPVAVLKGLKPLLFIIIFTFIFNSFLVKGGELLLKVWFIEVYEKGLFNAIFMAIRLTLLVAGTSLLTLTTSPLDLTDGLERLMKPLKVIKFPAHEMSMMMSIALRFIPTLAEEADRIMKAQAARGADFDTGGIIKRAMSLVPLLVPLFIGAFRRADDLAVAMEARCYNGGEGRTKMKVVKAKLRDLIAVLIIVSCYTAIIAGGL